MITLIRPANKEPGRRYLDKPVPGVSTIPHNGNDYGWGAGWQVYAAAAGRVTAARWSSRTARNNRSGGYGNYIIIDHGGGYTTLYAHMPNTVPMVSVGEEVVAHQQIGLMGNTGNASGPHLHFELRHNGRIIDPNPYIGGTSTGASSQAPIVITALPEPKEEDMKIVKVAGGTIALISEFTSQTYTSTSQGWSYALNEKVFGAEVLTPDEVTTLIREAANRRSGLVAEIVSTLIAAMPQAQGGAGADVDYAAIAAAVQDEQDKRERERLA
jgi:hypothetical protein